MEGWQGILRPGTSCRDQSCNDGTFCKEHRAQWQRDHRLREKATLAADLHQIKEINRAARGKVHTLDVGDSLADFLDDTRGLVTQNNGTLELECTAAAVGKIMHIRT